MLKPPVTYIFHISELRVMVQSSNIFYPEAEHAGRICRHYNMNLPHVPQSIKKRETTNSF